MGRRKHGEAHWRNLTNTTESSVCGDDASLCQIILTLVHVVVVHVVVVVVVVVAVVVNNKSYFLNKYLFNCFAQCPI